MTKKPSHTLTGNEPSLHHPDSLTLSGLEPLLGGLRRIGVDSDRFLFLLACDDDQRREAVIAGITDLGQADLYAPAFAEMLPSHARTKQSNWRGTFTPTQRVNALKALTFIGGIESLEAILDVLDDQHFAVREQAALSLHAICTRLTEADERALKAYRTLVCRMEGLKLAGRKVVVEILAESPPDLGLGPLLHEGLSSESWQVRRESAWALGQIADMRSSKRLIDALGDERSSVRSTVAWALGQIPADPIVPHLMACVETDEDEVVRATAIEALGLHATRIEEGDGDPVPAITCILSALEDTEVSVRVAAVEALSTIPAPEARMGLHRFMNR